MVYQGSKNRISKYIVPIIQEYIDKTNCQTYIEPFAGGCNIIDKIKCNHRIASDANKNLISLLRYIQSDNEIKIAPDTCPFEHYKDVRANQTTDKYSEEYVALIGYCASYGGKYFNGGYARSKDSKGNSRDMYNERLLNLKNQSKLFCGIEFINKDYTYFKEYKNCVFYLDPPYRGTDKYVEQKINYDEFYDFCRELSKNNIVLISEYWMPDDFECIWSKETKVQQKSDRTKADVAVEKLWILQKGRCNYDYYRNGTL